jgi:hypothetical protein
MARSTDRDHREACGSSPLRFGKAAILMNEVELRRKLRNFPSARLAQRINPR